MPFKLLFEQFHILGFIHSGVGRNEVQASSATARHDTPNNLAWWVFHCGYNIFLIKSLTQWPSNVHVARFKLLHGAFNRKQHIFPPSECRLARCLAQYSIFFFSTGVRCGFRAGIWDFSQKSLCSKQCWNLVLYFLTVKYHGFSCRSSLARALLSVVFPGRSSSWITRPVLIKTCHQH